MSMGKDHGPSIQDDDRYEALREEGMSKEKAAERQHASSGDERQRRPGCLRGLDDGAAVRQGQRNRGRGSIGDVERRS